MICAVLLLTSLAPPKPADAPKPTPNKIYQFKVETIDGKPRQLRRYRGKVLLVVNVASKCGNTPQYEGLEKIYTKYKKQGLVVLGFPANNFGSQEPGTNAEIKTFCTEKYAVTFPMFAKISVKGPDQAPLYAWLQKNGPRHEDIEWNFAKFLIGRNGKVAKRFAPQVVPEDPELVAAIEAELARR